MKCLLVATVVLSIISTSSLADETLKFRHVQHPTSVQTQPVGDVNGHNMMLIHLPGVAFFPDGSTGRTVVLSSADSVNGTGTASGYFTLYFDDGSELEAKFTGTFNNGGTRVAQKGTFVVTGGKGRYAGAKGDGTYTGESSQSVLVTGGGGESITYIDNVFNIKK